MPTLNIKNTFELATVGGTTLTGKHGAAADDADTALDVTVTGSSHYVSTTLATATVVTVYDDDNDVPADWDYLYFWADQDCYIQLIGSGTNVILGVEAEHPFVLSRDSLLAAADTTIITGGTEPTLTDIDSVVIGNYSGTTMNYVFAVID